MSKSLILNINLWNLLDDYLIADVFRASMLMELLERTTNLKKAIENQYLSKADFVFTFYNPKMDYLDLLELLSKRCILNIVYSNDIQIKIFEKLKEKINKLLLKV
jgi:hypothetical protein